MSEQADDSADSTVESHPDPREAPPAPQSADVPPSAVWFGEDRLDLLENARRTSRQRSRTDLLLLAGYVVANVVLIAVIVLARRHFLHH